MLSALSSRIEIFASLKHRGLMIFNDIHGFLRFLILHFNSNMNQNDYNLHTVFIWSISFIIALQHTILNQNQSLTWCHFKKWSLYKTPPLGFAAALWLKKDSPMVFS